MALNILGDAPEWRKPMMMMMVFGAGCSGKM
jgi:hypothetical protein